MVITSKSNSKIKETAKLVADRKYREESGLYVVEGIKPVNECIAAECGVSEIICVESLAGNYPSAIIVTESVFKSVSSEKSPQGVLAVVKTPVFDMVPPEGSCLLLDKIQDPGNLGTILRTANAAGYKDIYLINCTDAYSPKCVRASMSGIFFVRIHVGDRETIMKTLEGVPLVCGALDGENIFDFVPPAKFCLCIGNEGGGISREILEVSDYKVKIPMTDTCESLNAAVSAGIAMYQLKNSKQR